MEFVQFHPTGMVGGRYGEAWDGRLVTEAVRGEGGRLFTADGERFMTEYAPDQMELAARDVVARAIDDEVAAGNGTEHGGVFLDVSHRDRAFVRERLPRMYERFADLGVDLAADPVEVAPTAHYGMGGVVVDDAGETAVDGLYAIGETMAGVHGANRLGGNSLAETIAYGQVTGEAVAARLDGDDAAADSTVLHDRARRHFADLAALSNRQGAHDPEALFGDLRDLLEAHAGIRRDGSELTAGLDALAALRERAADVSVGPPTDRSFEFALNLQFGLVVAEAILRSARERTESRGAHSRIDHPDVDPDWRRNVVAERGSLGSMALSTASVGRPSEAVRAALDAGHELEYHQLE
jgi:succinate dehydrogenase / fumarate reductase flavoprotein subunit